jgi:hypothetical protein
VGSEESRSSGYKNAHCTIVGDGVVSSSASQDAGSATEIVHRAFTFHEDSGHRDTGQYFMSPTGLVPHSP